VVAAASIDKCFALRLRHINHLALNLTLRISSAHGRITWHYYLQHAAVLLGVRKAAQALRKAANAQLSGSPFARYERLVKELDVKLD